MSGEKRSRLGPTPKPFDPAALDQFASGALTVPLPGSQEPAATPESPPSAPSKTVEGKDEKKASPPPTSAAAYPWEEPQVREDVKKQILLRVPEPLYLQLQYLSKKSQSEYTSMNQIILDGTEKLVKAELKKLGIKP